MKSKKPKKIKVFVDGVDWQHEIGYAIDGNTVYPDVDSLKKYNTCWDQCGIVECELVFKKWVSEQDFKKMSVNSKSYTAKELEENNDILLLEFAERRLERLEEQVSNQKQKVINLTVNLKEKNRKK